MKKYCPATLIAGLLAVITGCDPRFARLSGGWSDADLKAGTNAVQTAEIPAGLQGLVVDNHFGNVHITGTDHEATGWTWKLTVRARTDLVAQQIAGATRCQVEQNGDQLKLVVLPPDSKEPHSLESNFEIRVPKAAAVRVQNHFGRIEIAGLGGDAEVTDQNGPVEIHDIGGRVQARTSFEALTVSNTGPATLTDQNGAIRATDIGGPLAATTCFDSLEAKDVAGPATLNDQNGAIKATGIHGRLDARTSFDALVVKEIGAAATLHNQNGRIEAVGIGGALDAGTSFDALTAQDVDGPAHLHNQNGGVRLSRVKGDAEAETSFDGLSAEDGRGNAILKNQNGGVTASGVTGSVRAGTSFAEIKVTGAGSQFVCHNQNGAIRLHVTSTTLTNLEATTSFEALEIHLPAGLQPAIRAHTTFGEVESDFPVLANPTGGEPFAGVAPSAARVRLENQNGGIRVVRD